MFIKLRMKDQLDRGAHILVSPVTSMKRQYERLLSKCMCTSVHVRVSVSLYMAEIGMLQAMGIICHGSWDCV